MNYVLMDALLGLIPVFANLLLTPSATIPGKIMIAGVMTVLMLFFGFIFSSVAGYMAGLVGQLEQPDLGRHHRDRDRLGPDPGAADGQGRPGRDRSDRSP